MIFINLLGFPINDDFGYNRIFYWSIRHVKLLGHQITQIEIIVIV